jgi:hypothetical protein
MKSLMTLVCACLLTTGAFASQQVEIQVQSKQNTSDLQASTVDYYSYYFGRVWLNTSSYASYKLTNTGTTPLTFQRATISGADYSATHSCTGVLAPNAVCQFNIRFSPFWEGYRSGRFVLSFVEDLDIVVDVSGEGYRM